MHWPRNTWPIRDYAGTSHYSGNYKANVFKVKVLCSNLGFIADIAGPFPGASSDPTLYRLNPPSVPPGCYLLGDKAHVGIPTVVPPIKNNEGAFHNPDRDLFNSTHGHYRARVEQTIRVLKVWGCVAGRWRSHDLALLQDVLKVLAEMCTAPSVCLTYPTLHKQCFPFLLLIRKKGGDSILDCTGKK